MFWNKKKPEPTYREQLVEAKAKLARTKKLPASAFTTYGGGTQLLLQHGVDRKSERIAELEAEVAYLEVKVDVNGIRQPLGPICTAPNQEQGER